MTAYSSTVQRQRDAQLRTLTANDTSTAKRPFAVFDIDGTLIRWQLYHSLVDQLAKMGHISKDDHDAIKQARMTWKNRAHSETFREYQSALVMVFHENLTRIKVADFELAVDSVFQTYKDQVYTYTRDLIQALRAKNYLLFAISGSHDEIIQKLAKHFGFDAAKGNAYQRKNGYFTGEHEHIVDNKPAVLEELLREYNATPTGSIAVGDSASDVPLLEVVEQPIAFNPDAKLFEVAKQNGWLVVIERKNVVYRLENRGDGYELV